MVASSRPSIIGDKNFTKGKIASRLAHLEADAERFITEMVRVDRHEEGAVRTEKVAHLAQRCGRLKQEIEKLKAMDKALADAPDGQISLTDPDARAMATSARNSGLVDYNAQCAVDTETHIIVSHDVTNKGFDRDLISPMAIAPKEALGRDELHALADKSYFSGVEIVACDKACIMVTMPRPETPGNRSKGMYVKADFKYDAARDVYICPTGDELTYRYIREEDGLQVRRYWTNECQHCPVKSRCTSDKERRITRWDYEHLVDEMRDRLRSAADPMTLRLNTVEHPFGTIKAWMGSTHFLMHSLKNVRTEMGLNVLAYNIRRMVTLAGIKGLMAAIPA
jgi:hypothetical protein